MTTSKNYKVIVSDQALEMLGRHIKFIAKINKAAARAKKKELLAAMASLSHMPQRFPIFEDELFSDSRYYKMFVPKWYIIVYLIEGDTVFVDYILDCRKDYGKELT